MFGHFIPPEDAQLLVGVFSETKGKEKKKDYFY